MKNNPFGANDALDKLILATPSGKYRNKLTNLNLILLAIEDNNPDVESLVDAYINENAVSINGDKNATAD